MTLTWQDLLAEVYTPQLCHVSDDFVRSSFDFNASIPSWHRDGLSMRKALFDAGP